MAATTYVVTYRALGRERRIEVWACSGSEARQWVAKQYPGAAILTVKPRLAF